MIDAATLRIHRYPMKTLASRILALAALLACTGCSSVLLEKPFPVTSPALDQEVLSGDWQVEEGFLSIRFRADGTGNFATPTWKDDRFELEQGEFITAQGPSNRYFCARVISDTLPSQYVFARYAFTATNEVTFWWPRIDVFAEAVKAGYLDGTTEFEEGDEESAEKKVKNVTLSTTPEFILNWMDTTAETNLFQLDNPSVMRKAVASD